MGVAVTLCPLEPFNLKMCFKRLLRPLPQAGNELTNQQELSVNFGASSY